MGKDLAQLGQEVNDIRAKLFEKIEAFKKVAVEINEDGLRNSAQIHETFTRALELVPVFLEYHLKELQLIPEEGRYLQDKAKTLIFQAMSSGFDEASFKKVNHYAEEIRKLK